MGVRIAGTGDAADRLQRSGVSWESRDLSELVEALETGSTNSRAAAARYLRTHGADAVGPLCRSLTDEEMTVRTAAAESLGRIRDVRAVEPLCWALKSCLGGCSARTQLRSLVAVCGALLAWFLVCAGAVLFGSPGTQFTFVIIAWSCASVVVTIFGSRLVGREQSKLIGAISEALAAIAERNPDPELRDLVPELQAIAADRVQQERETRRISGEAARRIDSATADLKNLPRPASAPTPHSAVLPRPAGAPAPDAHTLPRVR